MPINFEDHPPDPFVEYTFARTELDDAWKEHTDMVDILLDPRLGHTVAILGGVSTYPALDPSTDAEIMISQNVVIQHILSPQAQEPMRREFCREGHAPSDYTQLAYPQGRNAVAIARDRVILGKAVFSAAATDRAVNRYKREVADMMEKIGNSNGPWPQTLEDCIIPGFEALLQQPPRG